MPVISFTNRSILSITFMAVLLLGCSQKQETPEQLPLKSWMPKSIYRIPETDIQKPKFPVIDMHAHDYATTKEEVARRIEIMNEAGIEKSVVFTAAIGAKFDSIYALYSAYPDRFDVYCGFDYSGYQEDGFGPEAVAELERCVRVGAAGVGELGDKGSGMAYSPTQAPGMHPDDARMDPLFKKCAELGIPVNLHIADPLWMYEPMDSTNDGLMRSYTWRITNQNEIVGHGGMIEILANTLKRHPNTTFVAAHLANLTYDLSQLGGLFDKYPNLYADISARFAEFSTIPRVAAQFFERYQDRLVYGTDYGWETFNNSTDYGNNTTTAEMFRMTFRVLETSDDHFYLTDLVGYKWPLYGLGLSEEVLRKIYRGNALKIIEG